jgi:uncharacterized protein YchJ
MNEYPEFFKLNQTFYLDVLNEKKTDYLTDIYYGKYKRANPGTIKTIHYDEDDNFNDTEEKIFVRTSPKIGRNVPCPCGSGKKYKRCCG